MTEIESQSRLDGPFRRSLATVDAGGSNVCATTCFALNRKNRMILSRLDANHPGEEPKMSKRESPITLNEEVREALIERHKDEHNAGHLCTKRPG